MSRNQDDLENVDLENQPPSPTAPSAAVIVKDIDIPTENGKRGGGRRRCLWILGAILIGLIVLGVGVGLGLKLGGDDGDDANNSSSTEESAVTDETPKPEPTSASTPAPIPVQNPAPSPPIPSGPSPFISVGCFRSETSLDTHPVLGSSFESWAWQCSSRCFTRYFGVSNNICSCFVVVPDDRLAIGSCASVTDGTPEENRMELYFNERTSTTCSQERTETVRNFLVEEDDAPFGFDIVSNTFRTSPFDLYKDECGTNIYEVQTEVSEGSKSLQTSVDEVRSFALERRSERSTSLETSAEVSYKSFLFQASASVSASYDSEQTNLFKSSGAGETTSKVFTSTGVKRLMEVKIVDFDNTYRFVTLSRPFGNILRSYLNGGFQKDKAYEIITKYGQFILTRGIFGGYMQLRTTMLSSELSNSFESEQEALECYEASVSVEASGFGFSGKGSVGAGGCTEEAANSFRAGRNKFLQEVREQTVVGGRKACATCEDFVVEAQDSTLLTTKDKYPPGDSKGVQFRLLSDFLAPDKISPLEVKRLQITEDQFGEIHSNLQGHILEYLSELGDVIGQCDCSASALPYLDEDSEGKQVCACYDPDEPSSTSTIALKPDRTFSKRGNRRTCAWDRCPSSRFNWNIGNDCTCQSGLNSCFMEGSATDVEYFTEASLTPVEGESNLWKMEATGTSMALGQGIDCASGNRCFDDPLRGGFTIDLTDTDYEFHERTKVTVDGWSPRMQVKADGVSKGVYELNAANGSIEMKSVPTGTKVLSSNCGGWCGGCTSELYVRRVS
eukprot:CAMPEP_0194044486 /NCGR_PEP_ID=MMETSP0009_2-20130614/15946_1 /TAXON_ID=210454 /ORGANISM="Grammatophora oceanica, Strain CCMP 410" /LENGTH=786 /DNA_ID=CAMNT_0038689017 /DNA_START=185 /DNA_END=2545 /DNA_ORIENTATION=+